MSEKRTGEVRPAIKGERWRDSHGQMRVAIELPTVDAWPILRMVEDFVEVERPSEDAYLLARKVMDFTCRADDNKTQAEIDARNMAREIMLAEEAFSEPPLPTAEFTRDSEPAPPRPVDASDAVTGLGFGDVLRLLAERGGRVRRANWGNPARMLCYDSDGAYFKVDDSDILSTEWEWRAE